MTLQYDKLRATCSPSFSLMTDTILEDYRISLVKIQANTTNSVVIKAYSNLRGHYIAVKIIDKNNFSKHQIEKQLTRELELVYTLKHPYIGQFLKCYDLYPTKVAIITMFYSSGTVFSYVHKFGGLCEAEAARIFRQLMIAVAYLHDTMNIAHRDIKLENMLLDEYMNVKLIDFGYACQAISVSLSVTICGTKGYMSPQLQAHIRYRPFAADIYACGVTLYLMLTARDSADPNLRFDVPYFFPEGKDSAPVKRLVAATTQTSEDDRPSASSVLTSSWLIYYSQPPPLIPIKKTIILLK